MLHRNIEGRQLGGRSDVQRVARNFWVLWLDDAGFVWGGGCGGWCVEVFTGVSKGPKEAAESKAAMVKNEVQGDDQASQGSSGL